MLFFLLLLLSEYLFINIFSLHDFYKLGDETFIVKNSKPKNNSEELKKEIFYNTLDTLLEQERKNKDDNSLYKFQFSV